MQNYTNSDYALNKINKKAIVYRFADYIVEITLAGYLAENPDKTEADFRALKELSDTDYYERDRFENAQTKRNTLFDELDETALCRVPSPEDLFIGEISAREETEQRRQCLATANRALDKLTEVQRRGYLIYHVEGLSTWEIAKSEGVNQSKIMNSMTLADKKIEKVLSDSKK